MRSFAPAKRITQIRSRSISKRDSFKAFSLRDGDDSPEDMGDLGSVIRLRLHCRAAENLMLTDEALARAGTEWSTVTARLNDWLDRTPNHPRREEMLAFRDAGYDRRFADLKDVRMLIAAEGLAIDGKASTSQSFWQR